MRNKFLKGLSVAFAAAMAFTVVAPALTTEAASSKAYVVSEKMEEDGTITKYTYDSRGRVTKKVETSTAGTQKTVQSINKGQKSQDTVTTTVNINGKDVSTTQVVATTYDLGAATFAVDAKSVTTTTYTYYNSGAKKDQKKSESTTNETYNIVGCVSSADNASYGYYTLDSFTKDVAFTYDSKGNLIKDVTTTKTPGTSYGLVSKGNGVLLNGTVGEWNEDYIKAQNAISAHNSAISVDTKNYTVNSKGQTTRVDRVIEGGQHTEIWNAANTEKIDSALNGDNLVKYEGIYATWKYNKNGFPTEYVATNGNKTSFGDPTNGYTMVFDDTDSVTTYKYTYGDDMQLQKKVVTGKNPAYDANGNEVSTGTIETTVTKYKEDGVTVDIDASTYASVNSVVYGNDFTRTTSYHYDLKEGSTAKTYETANTTTVTNGIDNKVFGANTVKYTLKKISVPSSRLTDVMLEQANEQTAFDWK